MLGIHSTIMHALSMRFLGMVVIVPFDIPFRYLSHTELAPLRAPLIPMEHCTTRFFDTCDLDNDKYIALEEWANCFGIKESKYHKSVLT